MAGESAREVARRAREKAERLKKRAELFEQGADGEAETARVLTSLGSDWVALHDVRWPGRRLANVDHVLVGPGGVFVIDSKNWSGRITMNGGHLRQNGYSREKTAAGAADAALAVGERISAYAAWVHPVLCFVRQDHLSGCCREVMVCSSANLVEMLTTRPVFSRRNTSTTCTGSWTPSLGALRRRRRRCARFSAACLHGAVSRCRLDRDHGEGRSARGCRSYDF
jgi:hypothetical protein